MLMKVNSIRNEGLCSHSYLSQFMPKEIQVTPSDILLVLDKIWTSNE